jgi:hypothetical protein
MKKLAGLFALLVLVVVPAVAQDAPPQDAPSQSAPPAAAPDTSQNQNAEKKPKPLRYTPKYEISAGFAHRSYYISGGPKIGMNGWYGSFDYNWKRWLGFMGEAQGVYKALDINQNASLYTILGGPQVYPFKHRKLTPFGHFLYGEGYFRTATGAYGGFPSGVSSDFSHAWEVGGGLDVNVWRHWSVRAIQFDYGSTHFFSSSGTTGQGSYRVSFGVVYYFGEK